jgi:hypothetical protein
MIGCSITVNECVEMLLPTINRFWEQASIRFNLTDIIEDSWEEVDYGAMQNIQRCIWSLERDFNSGKMQNKGMRKNLFLDVLLPHHMNERDAFDIYLFDFIGHRSQGM